MRIAQIAPIASRVPPLKYGGTERVVHALTEELVRRGHEVTLFASGDSVTDARLVSVAPHSLRELGLYDLQNIHPVSLLHYGHAYEQSAAFDIVHDHAVPHTLPMAQFRNVLVVGTLHTRATPMDLRFLTMFRSIPIVALSDAHASSLTDCNVAEVIHNGLPMTQYPTAEPGNYLLYVADISREKGAHHAVEVARRSGMRLVIAGKVEPQRESFFEDYIIPNLNGSIRYVGEVGEDERNRLMSRAYAFLHPAIWDEPFGLTLIESQACGTPVIAFNRGAIPEIVNDGITGFVVDNIDQMVAALARIGLIDRAACRAHALKHFSVERMVDSYEALYHSLMANYA